MSDNSTTVTKQETLAALRNPGELYVVMSAVTKLPFVKCDDETYDDEIFLYYRVEDAKEKAQELLKERYLTAVAKLEDKQLLPFYTSLYTIGVNCLAVNHGTDTQISIQLSDLVVRKNPEELPDGKKLLENPALQLTAIYFMQEMRRQEKPQPTEELKELQEELLAHYSKASFIIAVQEDKQIPVLKQKNGDIYQPVFTDLLELQKFTKGKKMRTAVIPAAKIPDILVGASKGVVINPLGVNVQLQVAKKKKTQAEPVKPEADA
ncbi:SseB family protein [Mediterraneibacter glycyrrhizinilyticus]|uniref:SseB family protein n=1 Tax=Mediterraneibacter glycyrrhizinilyticus TaxID=342942 RepID=UPI0019607772|nr:SseB family protein [Mediterraneibacter glycyrrhizinilyticus]MBM6802296.1 SseB family protein [Mediterraneibacter glycyrrhizinilyticus]MDM8124441.1 SseB family protein [Mediterraneibacter glycyrrhizinilyticus]